MLNGRSAELINRLTWPWCIYITMFECFLESIYHFSFQFLLILQKKIKKEFVNAYINLS